MKDTDNPTPSSAVGFEVQPAANGGYAIYYTRDTGLSLYKDIVAACTTPRDTLIQIARMIGAPEPYVEPRDAMRDLFKQQASGRLTIGSITAATLDEGGGP